VSSLVSRRKNDVITSVPSKELSAFSGFSFKSFLAMVQSEVHDTSSYCHFTHRPVALLPETLSHFLDSHGAFSTSFLCGLQLTGLL
jgi:hypothetical protein